MSALEKGLLLHIGLPKTGTTTVQRSLFAHHSEIYYFGKDNESKFSKGCRSPEIYEFLKPLLWDRSRPLDADKARRILQERILPKIEGDKFMIASWEALGNTGLNIHTERMNRLLSVFGSLRIMMTIRNPLSWIPSLYLQNLSGNFIIRNRPWMGKLPYIDISEWFEKLTLSESSLNIISSYSRNIQAAVNLLGKENVGVFAFEELVENPDQYYSHFCEFIGIDVAQGLALTEEKHLHHRMTQNQIEFLKQMNSSKWNRFMLNLRKSPYRAQILDAKSSDGIPAKVPLPPELKQTILEATRAGNRWIAENYHLPLEKYNYPL
jgi:hypothetical protein